jgi:ubiquinone/menaquinone biosynthesis C-methylase UbiE
MEFTGERYIPGIKGSIEFEHINRYYFVINQINLAGKRVLDIASGEGYGSDILAKHAELVIGVDISHEAIDHATNKYKSNNLKFIQGDISNIPLDENTVDIVVSFETIEHHDKHDEMLKEIKRVLVSNGILIISSPNKQHFINSEKNIFHVKELFTKEFKDLIDRYFLRTIYFSQRVFTGSIIALDEINYEYKKPIVIYNNGTTSDFNPIYNIAIGTDNVFYKPNNNLILYNESDEIVTHSDIITAIQNIRNTRTYRLGKMLTRPYSIILKIIKRINLCFH